MIIFGIIHIYYLYLVFVVYFLAYYIIVAIILIRIYKYINAPVINEKKYNILVDSKKMLKLKKL